MKATLFTVGVLAVALVAQVAASEDTHAVATWTAGVLANKECFVEAFMRVAGSVLNIPEMCIETSLQSEHPLIYFPICVVQSVIGIVEFGSETVRDCFSRV